MAPIVALYFAYFSWLNLTFTYSDGRVKTAARRIETPHSNAVQTRSSASAAPCPTPTHMVANA
jgi:hypothetical protein